jgi:F-type H+-transporting ATPase subunit delta
MSEALARRYAKAFVEITTPLGIVDDVGRDLLAFADVLAESRDLRVAVENPAIGKKQRMAILEEVLRRLSARPETARLVGALVERDRLGLLRTVALAYQALADEASGRARAEVISADALGDERLAQIRHALERLTGKKVVISHRQDEGLLAGVVTRVGSRVYDGSLRTQMRQLRDALLEG